MSTGMPRGSPLPPPDPLATAVPAPPAGHGWAPPTSSPGGAGEPLAPLLVQVSTPPVGAWVLLGVALAAAIGALLPWAELSVSRGPGVSAKVSGTESNGRITLALGIVLGLAAVLAFVRRQLATWAAILAFVASALLIVIAIAEITDVRRAAGDSGLVFVHVEVGSGLWLTLAAGVVGIVGALLLMVHRQRR